MKINDNITLSIAAAVSDVLEGKKVKKEEADYPHDMWSPEGEKEVAKDEAEHKALAKKGYSHDKPEVDEVAEPVAKGEKDFKAKHKVKKSGEKEDGTVVKEKKTNEVLGFDKDNKHDGDDEKKDDEKDVKKEGNKFTMALNAARKNGDKDFVVSGKKYKVEDYDEDDKEEVDEAVDKNLVKKAVALALKMSGNMTGATKKIEKMQKGLSKDKEVAAALQLANEEVSESVLDEAASMNQAEDNKAKYKAFFDKALKKFGVESPAELEGDKKKEFFDYVDKNYNSEDEPGKDGAK